MTTLNNNIADELMEELEGHILTILTPWMKLAKEKANDNTLWNNLIKECYTSENEYLDTVIDTCIDNSIELPVDIRTIVNQLQGVIALIQLRREKKRVDDDERDTDRPEEDKVMN